VSEIYSQENETDNSVLKNSNSITKTILESNDLNSSPKSLKSNSKRNYINDFTEQNEIAKNILMNFFKPQQRNDVPDFDFIQSVNSNVKFGGIYDGNINIQIAPSLYIKPFSNISIYTLRQKNHFIPMKDIKENAAENFLPIIAEAAGMVLIEGISKIDFFQSKTLQSITEFILKNCVTILANSAFRSNEKEGSGEYNFYFLSTSISF